MLPDMADSISASLGLLFFASSAEADITHLDMGNEPAHDTAELRLLVSVRDRQHLADVLRTLRRAPTVLKVSRVKP